MVSRCLDISFSTFLMSLCGGCVGGVIGGANTGFGALTLGYSSEGLCLVLTGCIGNAVVCIPVGAGLYLRSVYKERTAPTQQANDSDSDASAQSENLRRGLLKKYGIDDSMSDRWLWALIYICALSPVAGASLAGYFLPCVAFKQAACAGAVGSGFGCLESAGVHAYTCFNEWWENRCAEKARTVVVHQHERASVQMQRVELN